MHICEKCIENNLEDQINVSFLMWTQEISTIHSLLTHFNQSCIFNFNLSQYTGKKILSMQKCP